MKRFEGKNVIITGATSGMGRITARFFAKEGASVIVVGRDNERGAQTVSELSKYTNIAEFIKCDVSVEENVKQLAEYISNKYKVVDVLFNNAGIWKTYALDEITEESINNSFASNYNSVVMMCKYFMPLLSATKGCIINNASIGGLDNYVSGGKQYVYAASKAAVIKFSKLLAKNYAPNIRVNCICPGIIDTEIFENRDFSRFNGTIPLNRIGSGDDVAKVVLFLASDDASYLTGVVLPIDGGASLM